MYDLVIISAGKFGRELLGWVYDAIEDGAPWRVKGFLDDRPGILKQFGYEEPILGPAETYEPRPNDRFFCSIGDIEPRRRYVEMLRARGAQFTTLVHPRALVSRRATLAAGVTIGPFVTVGPEASIGEYTSIGTYTEVSHDVRIGAFCQLTAHISLGGNVTIGDSVFLGLGAVVVPRITIHERVFVGAGSVVLEEVPPATKVFGNPAMPYGKVSGPA
jgi:sugar O-acyltransferase (sialic acid O-acetyltransferase NeuD family)